MSFAYTCGLKPLSGGWVGGVVRLAASKSWDGVKATTRVEQESGLKNDVLIPYQAPGP